MTIFLPGVIFGKVRGFYQLSQDQSDFMRRKSNSISTDEKLNYANITNEITELPLFPWKFEILKFSRNWTNWNQPRSLRTLDIKRSILPGEMFFLKSWASHSHFQFASNSVMNIQLIQNSFRWSAAFCNHRNFDSVFFFLFSFLWRKGVMRKGCHSCKIFFVNIDKLFWD